MKIEELNLTTRTYNCLKRRKIDTVEQLERMKDDELLGIRSLGHGSLAEIRSKIAQPRKTNGDRIRSMNDEELADFICSLAFGRETPWCEPFARKFCDHCPSIESKIEGYDKTFEFHECDFADGKCPHGSDIVWWLQQPAEEA